MTDGYSSSRGLKYIMIKSHNEEAIKKTRARWNKRSQKPQYCESRSSPNYAQVNDEKQKALILYLPIILLSPILCCKCARGLQKQIHNQTWHAYFFFFCIQKGAEDPNTWPQIDWRIIRSAKNSTAHFFPTLHSSDSPLSCLKRQQSVLNLIDTLRTKAWS